VIQDRRHAAPHVPREAFCLLVAARGVERFELAAEGRKLGRRRRALVATRECARSRLAKQLLCRRVALQTRFEQVVSEGEHAATSMVDQDNLVSVEQVV
jgi:hypothetical protein